MTIHLTLDEFQAALPTTIRKNINQKLIDQINTTLGDPEVLTAYKDNLISYTSVLQQGKFKITSYLNAVRYISYKLMSSTNIAAYIKTFPKKYTKFIQDGVEDKVIASYVSAYNSSKLVNLIYEQTLIPVHILNAPVFQQAINTQVNLMQNAVSEKVRSDAANSLLTHLRRPETQKLELNIPVDAGAVIDDYKIAMAKMVETQKELIAKGGDIKQIANAPIKRSVFDV